MATQADVAKVVRGLLDVYPSKEIGNIPGYIQMAAAVLRDVDAGDLEKAAIECAAELKFFPSLAELKERAHKVYLRGGEKKPMQGQVSLMMRKVMADMTQHLADKNPVLWTDEDHALFERVWGYPVWWKGEPFDTGEAA